MQEKESRFARYPSLEGSRVLVTGGATGIGEAIVAEFARQRAHVAFLDVLDEPAQALAETLAGDRCPKPIYKHCDLADLAALRAAIEEIAAELGAIDVLVNNAGNDVRHMIEDVTPEFWDKSMAVNLRPQFFAVQAVLPHMRKTGGGSIVNMSSISWVIPSTGLPLYVTAKAAIVGLTRTLAHELGRDNIRVNCVMPGAIATEKQKKIVYTPEYCAEIMSQQAIKRQIEPNEVARLVMFLAADDSSAITNQSYVIDAGWV
jgi:NAD(P)-dependent dehydrogenase (short-subunit alcohol dehydrogenase family)